MIRRRRTSWTVWLCLTALALAAVWAGGGRVTAQQASSDAATAEDGSPAGSEAEAGASSESPDDAVPRFSAWSARAAWEDVVQVVALAVGLSLAAWLVLKKRSRTGIAVLSLLSLAYFGFYLGGCVCPIGAIQNVTAGLFGVTVVPIVVVLIFALPLVAALLFGRVFCSGVCPLGAIQDVVLLRPLRLPVWLQSALGYVPYVYLGLAVLFAATDSGFIICSYDPFVSFFRLDGSPGMFLWGGALLAVATVVGRPYCRFLCPYGALLGLCSRVAWRRVSTTPDECVNCRLCEKACPFGAIHAPTYEGGSGG